MSIRDTLKQREVQRDAAVNGGSDFPDGVTRYVRMGKHGEVNADGRTFVVLADPDNWFFYFVHEDKVFSGKTTHHFQKHTCLHSPREIGGDLKTYFRPGKDACPSCKAGAKRKMYAMIPVYDAEYKTYRVIDTAEFHVNNIIADYDKLEKAMRKATKQPDYSIVGEAVHIKQVDKSFALESGDMEFEGASDELREKAEQEFYANINANFVGIDYGYADLAHFREESDLAGILQNASDEAKLDKAYVATLSSEPKETPATDAPVDNTQVAEEDLPF